MDDRSVLQANSSATGAVLVTGVALSGLDVDRMVPVHGTPASAGQLAHGLAIRDRYLPGGRPAGSR